MKNYVLKIAAVSAGCLSVAVVWSEVTFFNKSPVLSLFAQFVNLAKRNYDYFTIEVFILYITCYKHTPIIHIYIFIYIYIYIFFLLLDTIHIDHCISLLLRLFDRLKNSSIESLLFGASSSNQRV